LCSREGHSRVPPNEILLFHKMEKKNIEAITHTPTITPFIRKQRRRTFNAYKILITNLIYI